MDTSDVERRLRGYSLTVSASESASIALDLTNLSKVVAEASATYNLLPADQRFEEMVSAPLTGANSVQQNGAQPFKKHSYDISACIEKARQGQRVSNAFIEIFPQAGASALSIDNNNSHKELALTGMPFAYKDVFVSPDRLPTAGVGNGYRWNGPPSRVLDLLKRNGAVAIGATNLDPHCYTATGLNKDFGRVINPSGSKYAIGGSSGGSAVAVALGIVPFALGTDTGGSVRIPASLAGVYGFKPTQNLITDPGMAPLSPSQDNLGILAADPIILRRVFSVLTPTIQHDLSTQIQHLKIGIDLTNLCEGMCPNIALSFKATIQGLRALGATVIDVQLPPLGHLNALASVITSYEATQLHRESMSLQPEHYPAAVRRRLLTAALIDDDTYRLAIGLRGKLLQQVLNNVFNNVDVVVCPTLRHSARDVSGIAEEDVAVSGQIGVEHLRLNRPFSYLGLPALSIPAGADENGIPIGQQLISSPNKDMLLIRLAQALHENS
jgi:aspartyl-tRNA(Asn)/glutamyl-tRNA(Gln) amidotransferase subunit A